MAYSDDQYSRYWRTAGINALKSLNPFRKDDSIEPLPDWKQGTIFQEGDQSKQLPLSPKNDAASKLSSLPSGYIQNKIDTSGRPTVPVPGLNQDGASNTSSSVSGNGYPAGGTQVSSPAPSQQAAGGNDQDPAKILSQQPQGMVMRTDGQGSRTYTMNQADGGTGKMTVNGGQGGAVEQLVSQPQRPQQQQQSGNPFGGGDSGPAHAPSMSTAVVPPSMLKFKPGTGPNPEGEVAPKLLGPESGLGWKTRLSKYQQDMQAYNGKQANEAAGDRTAMQEEGANGRANLGAEGEFNRNQTAQQGQQQHTNLEQQRINQQGATNQVDVQGKTIANQNAQQLQNLNTTILSTDPNSPEYKQAHQQRNALIGKQDQKFQVITEKGVSDNGIVPTTTNYLLDNEGNTRRAVAPQVMAAPTEAIDFLKKNPSNAGLFKQKYGYLPEGF